jgi:hypothetical protein
MTGPDVCGKQVPKTERRILIDIVGHRRPGLAGKHKEVEVECIE